ncbi:hypothetical protein LOK49_LG09G02760 [Camellia lanceoleosa]|uniref:Uncharacterized protein n=1 Tax=Camellia lanceoleosa TaxID=1840588 RepID=A0ACC0GL33_9ERIC|nr:hypothetical protein LOK49_LG09G02760 [Camellia lanceoleosa]
MTSSSSTSPYIASLTLLFILLLFTPVTSRGEVFKKNSTGLSTQRRVASENLKRNGFKVLQADRKTRGSSRVHSSPLPARGGGVFNASAHEVPSGPNPISNRKGKVATKEVVAMDGGEVSSKG